MIDIYSLTGRIKKTGTNWKYFIDWVSSIASVIWFWICSIVTFRLWNEIVKIRYGGIGTVLSIPGRVIELDLWMSKRQKYILTDGTENPSFSPNARASKECNLHKHTKLPVFNNLIHEKLCRISVKYYHETNVHINWFFQVTLL